jgi:hypothetical protein
MALVNEQARGTSIGFLNPTLYGIGRSSSYGADFNDITSGSNANGQSGRLFSAVGGYDLVTGWGSPRGRSMINALSGTSPVILNGAHTLTPQSASGMRLDDWLSGTGAGNQIDIWGSNNTGAQSWVFSNVSVVPSGYYNLAVSYGACCVQASGSSSDSVVNLQPCDGSPAGVECSSDREHICTASRKQHWAVPRYPGWERRRGNRGCGEHLQRLE